MATKGLVVFRKKEKMLTDDERRRAIAIGFIRLTTGRVPVTVKARLV